MKSSIKNALHFGKFVLSHKRALLLSLGALATAEISKRFVAFWQKHLPTSEELSDTPMKKTEKSSQRRGNGSRRSRRDKRQIYQAPEIPKENLVPH